MLSAQTEEHITQQNESLFRETGAQIAVVAVDFLDGKDIEDYTYDLFNTWGVGSTQRDKRFSAGDGHRRGELLPPVRRRGGRCL